MILLPGKRMGRMALGQIRGAALAAAPGAVIRERAPGFPRVLPVLTGPSRHERGPASMARPARARRGPARARLVQAGRGRQDDLAIRCEADAAGDPRQVCPERRKEGLLMRAQWT